MDKKLTKASLNKCKKSELVELAVQYGIASPRSMPKDQLIIEIMDRAAPPPETASRANHIPAHPLDQVRAVPRPDILSRRRKKSSERPVKDIAPVLEETAGEMVNNITETAATAEVQSSAVPFELPFSYNVTKLIVMVRDPYWAYVYWDFDGSKYREVQDVFMNATTRLATVLRVHEITNIDFDGSNSNYFWDIEVDLDAKNWYIHLKEANRYFIMDLGLRGADGSFYLIARSNVVHTPLDHPSDIVDEQWMMADFYDLYASSLRRIGSFSLSSAELVEMKRLGHMEQEWLSSGAISSPVGGGRPGKHKDFFLEIGTEFILYGRTKPDATVYVEGKQVALRPDGTFTLRYNYPDGSRELPVVAISCDKEDERRVTVTLYKDTK